jgi:hypothetical protein
MIEIFTYRAAGHSTSDDPIKYRPADEPVHWPLGDPVDRLKQHLIALGEWDEERHASLLAKVEETVKAAVKEGEAVGTLGRAREGDVPDGARCRWTDGVGGFVRVIARKSDQGILGIQAVGKHVSDLSSQFATVMETGAVLEDVAGTIHVHPTLGKRFM